MKIDENTIERAARAYLEAFGIDPDEMVSTGKFTRTEAWKKEVPGIRAALVAAEDLV